MNPIIKQIYSNILPDHNVKIHEDKIKDLCIITILKYAGIEYFVGHKVLWRHSENNNISIEEYFNRLSREK